MRIMYIMEEEREEPAVFTRELITQPEKVGEEEVW